jgi:hypothetical protein
VLVIAEAPGTPDHVSAKAGEALREWVVEGFERRGHRLPDEEIELLSYH